MGVAEVAVADGERLFGDLRRGAPGGVGLVGEDADRRVAGLVALVTGLLVESGLTQHTPAERHAPRP